MVGFLKENENVFFSFHYIQMEITSNLKSYGSKTQTLKKEQVWQW
jgi:hypothetical protein